MDAKHQALTNFPPPAKRASPGLLKTLLRLELVTEEALNRVIQGAQPGKIIAALAVAGVLNEDLTLAKIALELSVEVVDLASFTKEHIDTNPEFFSKVTKNFALSHRCFPVREENGEYVFAFADPLDTEVAKELEFLCQCPIRVVLASEGDILSAIHDFLIEDSGEFDRLEVGGEADRAVEVMVADSSLRNDSREATEPPPPPVVRLVNKILSDAVEEGASDIHFLPTAQLLEVRFRIDGIMRDHLNLPKRLQAFVISRLKLLCGMDITERRRPQDGRFRMRTGGEVSRDVRVSSVPTQFGEKIVLRLLRPDIEGLNFDTLGMPDQVRKTFEDTLRGTDRIVIVTGPTGCGKTTTLYAALNFLRTGAMNIVTVEDPIEFRIEGAAQIQVDPKVGVTFASGLRSILRQDPDVIMVGEIRDLETAEIAFQAAQTGHLVLSSLHTNTAPSAVTRLLDLGLEPFVIASSLKGILAQRLVRKVCVDCARDCTTEERAAFKEKCGRVLENARVGNGCRACDNTGYRGRIGIFSFLTLTDEIRELIRSGASEEQITDIGARGGLEDLFHSGVKLIEAGLTTISEVERVVGAAEQPKAALPTEAKKTKVLASTSKPTSWTLPRASNAAAEAAIASVRTESIVSQQSVAKRSGQADMTTAVFVIESDATFRRLLVRLLKKENYEVVEAESSDQAMEKLSQYKPLLIISDCQGFEQSSEQSHPLFDHLNKARSGQAVPILLLGEAPPSISPGFQTMEVLSKSASPSVFLSTLNNLLSR